VDVQAPKEAAAPKAPNMALVDVQAPSVDVKAQSADVQAPLKAPKEALVDMKAPSVDANAPSVGVQAQSVDVQALKEPAAPKAATKEEEEAVDKAELAAIYDYVRCVKDEEERRMLTDAMLLRETRGLRITGVTTTTSGDTFAELSPNLVHLLMDTLCPDTENGVFVDIGCGTGLPLLTAALNKRFKVAYGWDRNPVLIQAWHDLAQTLQKERGVHWEGIVSKCDLWEGDVRSATPKMIQAIREANVVLCWNSRFDENDNIALFRFVAMHMVKPDAVFVCTTLRPVHVGLREVSLQGMAPKKDVAYCCSTNVRGAVVGRLKSDWFSVYKRDPGQEFETRRITRASAGDQTKRQLELDVTQPSSAPKARKKKTTKVSIPTPAPSSPTPSSSSAAGPAFTHAENALKSSPNSVVVGVGWTPSRAIAKKYDVAKCYEKWADPEITPGSTPLGLRGRFCYRSSGHIVGGVPELPGGRKFVFGGVLRNAAPGPDGPVPQEGHLDLYHNGRVTTVTEDGSFGEQEPYAGGILPLSDLRQALSVIAPFEGGGVIAVDFWSWTNSQWETIFADPEKNEFILFDPLRAWHRGNGSSQGARARIYTMYIPADSVVSIDNLIRDGENRVLRVSDVGGQPVRQFVLETPPPQIRAQRMSELKKLQAHNADPEWYNPVPKGASRASGHHFALRSVNLTYNTAGELFALCDNAGDRPQCRVIGKVVGKAHESFRMLSGVIKQPLEFKRMFRKQRGEDVQFDSTRKSSLDIHKNKRMPPEFSKIVSAELASLVPQCCEQFSCVLDGWGEDQAVVLGVDLLVSIAAGTHADVESRAQDAHRDISKEMYGVVGKAHLLFITGPHPRTLRICTEQGEMLLLTIPAYSFAVIHGRCVHGGWGVPSSSLDNFRDTCVDHSKFFWVLFAYVLMTPPSDVAAAEATLRRLPEVVVEGVPNVYDSSLDWPK
jgi:SAM-dependent methyltransferase